MNAGNRLKLNELTSQYLKDWNDADILSTYAWERSVSEADPVSLKEASYRLDKKGNQVG